MKHRLPEHRFHPSGSERKRRSQPAAEEGRLRSFEPALGGYLDGLKQRLGGRAVRALRRLERICGDHPRTAVLAAVAEAQRYGMYDLGRLERMVLRQLAAGHFGITPRDMAQLQLFAPEDDDRE